MAVKNAVLLGLAQARKQRQYLGVAQQRLVAQVPAQVVGRLANFTLTGQKHQDVTLVVSVAPEFVHTIGDGVVQVVITRLLKRPVALLHREHTARHHDDGRRTGFAFEVVCKALCIDGGRCHHHFQVGSARQDLAQVAQQKIDVEAALVSLVDDDGVVSFEQRVGLCLGQQYAVGHEFDRGVAAEPVLKPHLVAHDLAQWRGQFLGNALGHTAGGNAPRLRVADQLTLPGRVIALAAPHGQGNFGQLSGLAGTGFPANDDHLVLRHCRHDLVTPG